MSMVNLAGARCFARFRKNILILTKLRANAQRVVKSVVIPTGTEVFWPAVPPPVASNHASDNELQRQIIAGRGLSGGVSGPRIPQIATPSHCIDLV